MGVNVITAVGESCLRNPAVGCSGLGWLGHMGAARLASGINWNCGRQFP